MVNVAADQGDLRAEVLDAVTGQPVGGYHAADAVALSGDHLAGQVRWQTATTLPVNQTVQVRFYLQRAQLYSFWLAI
jgi:hypothetical protein